MISLLLAMAAAQTEPVDRTYEGDWYVSDDTDNNTGEREVYAFTHVFEPDYITLTLRCSDGEPKVFLRWDDEKFPDQSVVTFGPVQVSEPFEESYVFERSDDSIERGLKASAETSRAIIKAMGEAKFTTVTVRIFSMNRTAGIEVDGTQRAWDRVVRHCPVRKYPRPPI